MEHKITTEEVVDQFLTFMGEYTLWRKQNGLPDASESVDRICNCMTDKHGRICRQIKHQERNDPKSDWPLGMTEAIMGYLVYMMMLLEKYGDSVNIQEIHQGFYNELNAALDQHS